MDEPKRLTDDGPASKDLQLATGLWPFEDGTMAKKLGSVPSAIQLLLEPGPEGRAF